MVVGLNLSFAVKRWMDPHELAGLIAQELGVTDVQFTWDLIDPWWPKEKRAVLADGFRDAFQRHGLRMVSSFGGVAAYSYGQLLAPSEEQRQVALDFFKRGVDLNVELGASVLGTPLGGMTHRDAVNDSRREEIYKWALDAVGEITSYAHSRGLEKILIEPTPVKTEIPYSPEGTLELMQALDGRTAVPVELLIDWGHALYEPLLHEKADMDGWLSTCGSYVNCFHLQQTDGTLDGHWSFTQAGKLSRVAIDDTLKRHGHHNSVQYLELIYPFEYTDDYVRMDVKKTVDSLLGR